ncbi:MAG TPA: DUF1996 domain-containing protein [Pseudolysinimonas sp.]|nr:DUF1996 domain-containing protein [Pseudolysinimonas sp.]
MPHDENEIHEAPAEPVSALDHQAVAEQVPARDPARARRIRLIAAAIAGALVIAAGSATVTAFALTRTSDGAMGAMEPSTAAPTATAGAGPVVNTAGFPTGGPGIFTDTCLRTTTAPNDPILMPGMTGMSMQHDFFGNTGTTASSVTTQLVGSGTSCSTTADASAYWTPVLSQSGKALTPRSTLIYWRAQQGAQKGVQSIPTGLTMIAGDEGALAPQGKQTIGWTCSGFQQVTLSDSPHDCAAGAFLRLVITFPNCWDGHTLDGAQQTNVVAMTGKSCPSSHPVQIPQVVMHINYPTSSAADLTLSVGPTSQGLITTEHADFMNGWNEPVLTADVKACIVTGTRCGPVSGADAVPKGGKVR